MAGMNPPPVAGHNWCGCGNLVDEVSYQRWGRRCATCFTSAEMPELPKLIADGKGRAITAGIPQPIPTTNKKKPYRPNRRQDKLIAMSYMAANERLRNAFRDLWTVMYCEERVKRGLQPLAVVDDTVLEAAVATYQHLLSYHGADGHPEEQAQDGA